MTAAAQAGRPAVPAVTLALATVYLVWGSSYLATKVMVSEEPPLLAAGLRFTLAGLLLGAFAWWRGGPPRLTRTELRHVALLAAGTVAVSNGCNVLAMQHVASNVAALLNATPALFIAWLSTFGPRGTPLSGPAKLGLGLGLAGVALVLAPARSVMAGEAGWPLLVIVGCVAWSLATVYFRNIASANAPLMLLGLQMLAGGLTLLVLAALSGEPFAMHWSRPGTAAFLWLTLASSCLAYSAYWYLARNASPVLVGTYAYVNPAIAAVLGWLVLGETLQPAQVAGMLLILAAVSLATGYADRLLRWAWR